VIFKRTNELQGIILFNTTGPGEYSFIFANFDTFGTAKTVTFALHTYEENDVDPIEYDFTKTGERVIRGTDEKNGDVVSQNEDGVLAVDQSEASAMLAEIAGDSEIGSVRNILRQI
jgi:hypothetical protein